MRSSLQVQILVRSGFEVIILYKFNITSKEAFEYLYKYKDIEFIKEFYDIEHTLSLDDAVDDLTIIRRNNGGSLG